MPSWLEGSERLVFGRRDDLRSRRAGRMLAAILLAGFIASPFVGHSGLLVAVVVVAGVMLGWIALDAATEINGGTKRRARWRLATITIKYAILAVVVSAVLVGFVQALPESFGSIQNRMALRGLVLVWIAFTWFAPWMLASRAQSIPARKRRALGAFAAAAVGLALLTVAADGLARTVDIVAGAALIFVSMAHTFRSHLFPR